MTLGLPRLWAGSCERRFLAPPLRDRPAAHFTPVPLMVSAPSQQDVFHVICLESSEKIVDDGVLRTAAGFVARRVTSDTVDALLSAVDALPSAIDALPSAVDVLLSAIDVLLSAVDALLSAADALLLAVDALLLAFIAGSNSPFRHERAQLDRRIVDKRRQRRFVDGCRRNPAAQGN